VNRLPHVGLVAAVLVLATGCGGSAQRITKAEPTPPQTTHAQPLPGTINVTQVGTAAPKTMWFVRIERPDSKPLAEAGFPNRPLSFSRNLPAGKYRVIAWRRTCTGACPASGENGLGPLEEVCGTLVSMTAGQRVDTIVQINAGSDCTVTASP
jgi:hypothetical protein